MTKHPFSLASLLLLFASTGCSVIVDGQLQGAPLEVRCEQEPDGTDCSTVSDGIRRICVEDVDGLRKCLLSQCGDGFTDTEIDEQCDEDNQVAGDGCEPSNCQFSCNTDADCSDGVECSGVETCNLVEHTCVAGSPPVGAECTQADDAPGICNMGQCVPMGCGNNVVDEGEQCDDGNLSPDDGCEPNCTFSCETNAACDDSDECNGTETCDVAMHLCLPGLSVVCPAPADACHVRGVCETGVGCPDVDDPRLLMDADMDGYASMALGSCGTDCNDADADVFLGNLEVCGDGKDNNCVMGMADEFPMTWYADCDGDGYALSGANSRMACAKPTETSAGVTGCPNNNGDWTTRNPNSVLTRDCADSEPRAFPGAFARANREEWPTTAIPGTSNSWDWDCDGVQEVAVRYCLGGCSCPTVLCSPRTCCYPSRSTQNWTGTGTPSCGTTRTYDYCGDDATDSNCLPDAPRLQRCI